MWQKTFQVPFFNKNLDTFILMSKLKKKKRQTSGLQMKYSASDSLPTGIFKIWSKYERSKGRQPTTFFKFISKAMLHRWWHAFVSLLHLSFPVSVVMHSGIFLQVDLCSLINFSNFHVTYFIEYASHAVLQAHFLWINGKLYS